MIDLDSIKRIRVRNAARRKKAEAACVARWDGKPAPDWQDYLKRPDWQRAQLILARRR